MPNKVRNLPTTKPNMGPQARDQANAYKSVFADTPLELDNNQGTILIPPHPDFGMLDDDRMDAYEDLIFETESYDREPDIYIPEQKLDNGIVLPEETKRGNLIRPFRKTDENGVTKLIKPPHSVRVVQCALGEELYAKLKAGGKSAADVWRIWGEQGMEIRERRGRSTPDGGAVALAAVPEADSQ